MTIGARETSLPANTATSWSTVARGESVGRHRGEPPPAPSGSTPSRAVARSRARWLVPVIWSAVGLLMATSASTAGGTDLRADRRLQLTELIAREQRGSAALEARTATLRQEVAQGASAAAARDSRIRAAAPSAELEIAAGMRPMTGPGVRVSLDDAPRSIRLRTPGGTPDDYIVHEQDLQAVVNALRAAGAEAVTLMGRRLISTSAVRCVGSTVILEGRVYSPPFIVTAIGDPERMLDFLNADPGVSFYRTFVERFGVRYDADVLSSLSVPAFEGTLAMRNLTSVQHS